MTLFTNNPLERMMQQVPKAAREETPRTPAPEGHLCLGCGRYGTVCVHPCHREVKREKKKQNEL